MFEDRVFGWCGDVLDHFLFGRCLDLIGWPTYPHFSGADFSCLLIIHPRKGNKFYFPCLLIFFKRDKRVMFF